MLNSSSLYEEKAFLLNAAVSSQQGMTVLHGGQSRVTEDFEAVIKNT